jgi:hypothetical protein
MEEEIKNPELEKIVNEISKNLSDKPHLRKLYGIIQNGGGKFLGGGEETQICTFYTEGGKKFVEFYGDYKNKARSMNELKSLIDYLDREGYLWI